MVTVNYQRRVSTALGKSGLPGRARTGLLDARVLLRTAFALILITIVSGNAYSQQVSTIPWDDSVKYSRTSVNEPIGTILRSLLSANNLSAMFPAPLEGKVTSTYSDVAPRLIFEQIADQFSLAYRYDPLTRTVTVYPQNSEYGRANERAFFTLKRVPFAQLTKALKNFGLGTSGISYDPASRTVSAFGSEKRLGELEKLIETLEEHYAKIDPATLLGEDGQPVETARLGLADDFDWESARIKVIPLRFAEVGPTTKKFQGETMSIPGLEETLRALLGTSLIEDYRDEMDYQDGAAKGPGGLLGRGRISIDERTNSVVVWGAPRFVAEVERLVRELDKPQRMVLIEVVIARAEVGTAENLGIAWRGSLTGADGDPKSGAFDTGTDGGIVDGDSGNLFTTNGLDAISLLPLAPGAGGSVASFVIRGSEGFLQAQLRALSEDNKGTVLSAPRLVTLDNNTASITRSQNIFVQTDTGSENGVGLEEIRTGLTLEISPSVIEARGPSEETMIRLNLNAINSAPGGGVFGEIDVTSQEVQTNVLVPNGATYVIGGLFDDTYMDRKTGVPGLRKVPGVGKLFRSRNSSNTVRETIFFITPKVVEETQLADKDIATMVGSADYIERQRSFLQEQTNQVYRDSPAPPISIHRLEEDE